MLDHFAVHVGDVQRAVRADLHLHRAEPIIRRGEEFPVPLILWSPRHEADPGGLKFFPMNEIAPAVRDKGVPGKILRPDVTVVNRDAGGRSEVPGRASTTFDRASHFSIHTPARANNPPRLIRAAAKHRCRRPIDSDAVQG